VTTSDQRGLPYSLARGAKRRFCNRWPDGSHLLYAVSPAFALAETLAVLLSEVLTAKMRA
jgi:hypothetical protein